MDAIVLSLTEVNGELKVIQTEGAEQLTTGEIEKVHVAFSAWLDAKWREASDRYA